MSSRNTFRERESSHISSFCGGDPFCEVVGRPENTHEALTGLLEWPVGHSLSLEWPADLSPSLDGPADLYLQSKITDLIFSFQIPSGTMNILFASRFISVYGWLSEQTYFRFFPVIGWSYLRTEISVTLSIGNKLYSRHHILYFSFLWKALCWCYLATPLNLLSSSSPVKLVYYTWTLTKRMVKKLDGNYTRMLRAILKKSWRQHPTYHPSQKLSKLDEPDPRDTARGVGLNS